MIDHPSVVAWLTLVLGTMGMLCTFRWFVKELDKELHRPPSKPPITHVFISHAYGCATQWMDWIGFQESEVRYVSRAHQVRGMRNITVHLCGLYWHCPEWPEIKQYLDTLPSEDVRYKTHA